MTKYSLVTLLVLILSQISFGQMVCGTVETPQSIERLKANKRSHHDFDRDGEITYLPINFIRVGKDNGTGKINVTRIYKELCHINMVYAVNNVQFYLYDNTINETDNQTIYENAVDNPGLLLDYKVSGTINIFIVNNATAANSLGVTLGYFWPGYDYIVMLKTQIGKNGNTLPHELGHFFSLPHTFRGWDHDPWNEIDHGDIVSNYSPGGVLNEKVDGSNCNNAGDLICDTPADYNLGFGYSGECNNYQGNCHDPNGTLLAPMQGDIIKEDIENRISEGSLIEGGDLSDLYFDVTNFNYLSPLEGTTTASHDDITFEWDEIENVTNYFVQIDRIPTFSFNPEENYQAVTSINITSLTAGKKYYWRVWPLNKYITCPLSENPIIFNTPEATAIDNIELEYGVSISPNPVIKSGVLNIEFKANNIEIIALKDMLGRTIFSENVDPNETSIDIDISKLGLKSGIYYTYFRGVDFQFSKKIIVD